MDDTSLKLQILEESKLIPKTVDFLEGEINKHVGLALVAYKKKNFEEFEKQRKTVITLVGKLSKEIQNMDAFMEKYTRIINEKKAMLPDNGKKEQVYLRGVPTHQRRKNPRKKV